MTAPGRRLWQWLSALDTAALTLKPGNLHSSSVARLLRVYVHCTAGLGRAPAVCIAYLYWWCGMDLDAGYEYLTNIRPCGPKVRGFLTCTLSRWLSYSSSTQPLRLSPYTLHFHEMMHISGIGLCTTRSMIMFAVDAAQKEAIRGATYDLLDDRGPNAFTSLPGEAYAMLSDADRQRIQQQVLAWQS